ncbi:hypothetical protein BUH_0172 [Burkholderia pseudomallei Pakistan 9]|nr:hypothetical protein BUH_0172 [Burkholderia pseudomallei Pakistan 9]
MPKRRATGSGGPRRAGTGGGRGAHAPAPRTRSGIRRACVIDAHVR